MSQENLEILAEEWIEPSLVESEYSGLILREDSLASVGSIAAEDSIASVGSIAAEDYLRVEYSLDPVGSIAAEDYLPVEYSVDLEDSLDSEDSFDLEYSLDSGYFLESESSLELENSLASKYSLDSGDSIFFQEIEVDSLTGMPNDPTANARVNGSRRTTALRNPGLDITTFSYSNQALVTATVKVELSPILQFYIQQDWLDITLQCSVWGMDGGFFGNGNDRLFNFSDKIITGEGNYTFSGYVNRSVLNEDRSWFNNTDEIAAKFSLTSSDPAVPVNHTAWTNIVTGRY